ncbi:hypothetical protein BGW38_007547 [Lunasporangiospora selenospora]|uniref:Kelch motif-containing protein n=1 Tax=Lunasporangiospora selenospora TaxID=979761 RepID=A0A9P6G400_9FUNG|nr:hypothetical protein BGW38_007547 [Lunasporangiospora selenospora]
MKPERQPLGILSLVVAALPSLLLLPFTANAQLLAGWKPDPVVLMAYASNSSHLFVQGGRTDTPESLDPKAQSFEFFMLDLTKDWKASSPAWKNMRDTFVGISLTTLPIAGFMGAISTSGTFLVKGWDKTAPTKPVYFNFLGGDKYDIITIPDSTFGNSTFGTGPTMVFSPTGALYNFGDGYTMASLKATNASATLGVPPGYAAAWSGTLNTALSTFNDVSKGKFIQQLTNNGLNGSQVWEPLPPTGIPKILVGHCFVKTPDSDVYYLFGGRGSGNLYMFDLASNAWTLLGQTTPRSHMACAATKRAVIIWGGADAANKLVDSKDALVFDLESKVWSDNFKAVVIPPPPKGGGKGGGGGGGGDGGGDGGGGGGSSAGAIAGGVLGGLAVIGIAAFFWFRRRRQQIQSYESWKLGAKRSTAPDELPGRRSRRGSRSDGDSIRRAESLIAMHTEKDGTVRTPSIRKGDLSPSSLEKGSPGGKDGFGRAGSSLAMYSEKGSTRGSTRDLTKDPSRDYSSRRGDSAMGAYSDKGSSGRTLRRQGSTSSLTASSDRNRDRPRERERSRERHRDRDRDGARDGEGTRERDGDKERAPRRKRSASSVRGTSSRRQRSTERSYSATSPGSSRREP